jgi:c-di-GMP-binding flagellar brake protein YcgR
MNLRLGIAERRVNVRMAAAHSAILVDRRNRRILTMGRTANISENGILLVVRQSHRVPAEGEVCVRLTVPHNPLIGDKREVTYRCRIVRRQEMGNMLGLGLQFLKKLA